MKHLESEKTYKKASGFFHKEYRTVRAFSRTSASHC